MAAEAYLEFLGLEKEPPTKTFLQKLLTQHRRRVAVENLDFYYKQNPQLDVKKITEKLIKGRGSIPLHLNAAFCDLLKFLSFKAELRSIQHYKTESRVYQDRLHSAAIVVQMEGESLLIDVGSIHGITSASSLLVNNTFLDGTHYYQWRQEPFDEHWYLSRSNDAVNFSQFLRIEENEILLIEYLSEHERFQQKEHELSRQRWMYRLLERGYVYLHDDQLEIMDIGEKSVVMIQNEEAFWSLATQHFGISRTNVFNLEEGS